MNTHSYILLKSKSLHCITFSGALAADGVRGVPAVIVRYICIHFTIDLLTFTSPTIQTSTHIFLYPLSMATVKPSNTFYS